MFIRALVTLVCAFSCSLSWSVLPPGSEAAKAQTAATAAKGAWSDKVAQFQLCRSMDRVAEKYRRDAATAGKQLAPAAQTPACVDPGPYTAPTPVANKPLEAAGAHSPPGAAASPPSTTTPAAQTTAPK